MGKTTLRCVYVVRGLAPRFAERLGKTPASGGRGEDGFALANIQLSLTTSGFFGQRISS